MYIETRILYFVVAAVICVFTVSVTSSHGANAKGSLPGNYASLSALDKQSVIWASILSSRYPANESLPTSSPEVTGISPKFARKVFTITSDEYPPHRHRILHRFGTVGLITWRTSRTSPYTGIFQPGVSVAGLARLSLAFYNMQNIIPAVTLKLFLDGQPSLNLFAVDDEAGLGGQGTDRNFFARNLSNWVPLPRSYSQLLAGLGQSFTTAIHKLSGGKCNRPLDGVKLPVLLHAMTEPDGEEVGVPRAPTVLTFVANPAIAMSSTDPTDFRESLAKIPANTLLYQVYANATLPDGSDTRELIADVILTDQFVASDYGDSKLFFQHHGKRC
ncbi:uncharacterized protein LOC129598498 [Paramacrobiotus metropolitanus]|uniref:uncharacterized protein LOC129598498 n=1 Tax=Paramacrobiotus metropolitanus TaxID=2943436 RepID=UPI0024461E9F|nr:uncharacterized protein LOC129598498 [Paramacrobiotus metropolitanus]